MASYTGLSRITDPELRRTIKTLWDQIDLLRGSTAGAAWNGDVKAGSKKLRDLAPGTAASDAVTKAQLDEATDPRRFQEALQASGTHPITITGLPGATMATILYGTHATRLTSPAGDYPDGTIYYETDRKIFYQSELVAGVATWVMAMARPDRDGSLYGDLGTNDAGTTAFLSTEGYTARWSGTNWNHYLGSRVNTFALRPSLALADRGFLFIASDYGYHVWRKMDTPNDWLLMEGMGGPMYGTAANRAVVAATLGVNDTGFTHVATDQGYQLWRWSGTAFILIEGVGGPMRGTISPDQRPALGADDAGFLFYGTDDHNIYRWSGAGWFFQTIGLATGGTNANLAATGGASFVLMQESVGAAVTVRQLTTLDVTNLAAGTYTPTASASVNLDGVTPQQCQYLRVGTSVTVSGQVTVDPTTSGLATSFELSLPIASNFGSSPDAGGTGVTPGVASQCAGIHASAANNTAVVEWIATDTTSQMMDFSFTYRVIA